jgi:hypothetical protein
MDDGENVYGGAAGSSSPQMISTVQQHLPSGLLGIDEEEMGESYGKVCCMWGGGYTARLVAGDSIVLRWHPLCAAPASHPPCVSWVCAGCR